MPVNVFFPILLFYWDLSLFEIRICGGKRWAVVHLKRFFFSTSVMHRVSLSEWDISSWCCLYKITFNLILPKFELMSFCMIVREVMARFALRSMKILRHLFFVVDWIWCIAIGQYFRVFNFNVAPFSCAFFDFPFECYNRTKWKCVCVNWANIAKPGICVHIFMMRRSAYLWLI